MAIKPYISRTNVAPVGLSQTTGIIRGANAVAGTLLEGARVLDQFSDIAFKEGSAEAKIAGNIAAQKTDLSRDPLTGVVLSPEDTGGNFSIYDQSYRDSILNKYQSELQNDITKSFQKFAADNHDNPAGFKSSAGAYIKTVLEGVDPRVHDAVADYAQKHTNQYEGTIYNNVVQNSFINEKLAAEQTITRSTIDTLNLARHITGDALDNPEFEAQWSVAVNNIHQTARWDGTERVKMRIDALQRRVFAQQASGSFLKITDKIEKQAAVQSIIKQEGPFWDKNKQLSNFGPTERKNLAATFSAFIDAESRVTTAIEDAQQETATILALKALTIGLSDSEKRVMDIYSPTMNRAVLQFNVNNRVLGIIRGTAANKLKLENIAKRRIVEVGNENNAQAAVEGRLELLAIEGFGDYADALEALLEGEPTWKRKAQVVNRELKYLSELNKITDKQKQTTAISNYLENHLMPMLGTNANKLFNQIRAERPELLKNMPQLAMTMLKGADTAQRVAKKDASIAAAEGRRLDRQADSDHLKELRIKANLQWINTNRKEQEDRIQRILDDPNNGLDSITQKHNFLSEEVKRLNAESNNATDAELIQRERTNVEDWLEELGERTQGVVDALIDGKTLSHSLKNIRSFGSDIEIRVKAHRKERAEMEPYISAITEGTLSPGGKNAGPIIDRIMKEQFLNIKDKLGIDLDRTDPTIWLVHNIISGGIPSTGVNTLGNTFSGDPKDADAGIRMYRVLKKHPAGLRHIEGQLGAKIAGQLRKLNARYGGDAGKLSKTISAITEETTLPSDANKILLPDVADDKKNVLHAKVIPSQDTLINWVENNSVQYSNIKQTLQVDATGDVVVEDDRTFGSFPEGFKKHLNNLAMSILHDYNIPGKSTEENARAAYSAAYTQLTSKDGHGSYGWSAMPFAAPGTKDTGDLNLVQHPPERYFGVRTIDGMSVKWIEKSAMSIILKTMHQDHKPKWYGNKLNFTDNIKLEPIGLNGKTGLPVYNVRIIEGGFTTTAFMKNKKNSMMIIDLSKEYTGAKIKADFKLTVDLATRRVAASVQRNKDYLSRKGQARIRSMDGNFIDAARAKIFDPYKRFDPSSPF